MSLFGCGLISCQQVKRQFQGGRLPPHPASLRPHPPPYRGPLGKTEGNTKQPSDGGPTVTVETRGSSAGARLKEAMRASALLSSESKTSGQPPAIHLPWNKARIRPVEEVEGGRGRLRERKGDVIGRRLERGDLEKIENKGGGKDEATAKGGRKVETWGRSTGGGAMNNEMRNAIERGECARPERRDVLSGLLSTGHFASRDHGIIIDGSYFQTCVGASKPPPVKQKLSDVRSLISLARRLQGPARVGDEQWGNRRSWERGEKDGNEMYGSAGDMSVSASVSEMQSRGENSSSEAWWKREGRLHDNDSETGSSGKEVSSATSSVKVKREGTQFESESGADKEEGAFRTKSVSGRQSRSESEPGLKSEDEGDELGRKSSQCSVSKSTEGSNCISSESGNSCAVEETGRSSRSSNGNSDPKSLRCSTFRAQTSRRSPSSHETIVEESGEDEDSGEEKGGRESSSCNQSDMGPGAVDASDDLSPIPEDAEEEGEEEKSSGHVGGGDKDEDEGDLENESAD